MRIDNYVPYVSIIYDCSLLNERELPKWFHDFIIIIFYTEKTFFLFVAVVLLFFYFVEKIITKRFNMAHVS